MPEGDTVFRTAARLRTALAGKLLTYSDFRVPRLATVDLSGRAVTAVRSRGKHLLIDVGPGDGQEPVSIRSHLSMEGSWDVLRVGERWHQRAHTARVVLRNDTYEAVGFALGTLDLMADPDGALAYLGPDLLGDDWDAAEAARRIARHPDTPIGIALLDQRRMAGVGNEYRSELCFLRGVLPTRRVGDVDVPAMVDLAHRMLVANRTRLARTTTGKTGRTERLWVYGRRAQPCRRCATPIQRDHLGTADAERVIYFCPRCQT
ncbi:DNA-formamidopyrimidine glycosylase family protein [Gordonia sp. NB41Y]|uniref:DNA-formamidopyrimidine glycosylase family protein n=1 Tax=Gordonia sp. NB41Y TaxID=875808 RepID=UPI0002BF69AB|nr:DNA-formamidopyrimidine glycosylase family protein [Gordonia sp. NB41Y]EMP10905.1 DNA glycosylase [Gordonia sp. NB41Y]WLP91527.1 DNA-formamidopyrimidine glycosylase family protein [Gordonia sp. NB41Y]